MKKIAIGSDHIGINHKAFLIEKLKLQGYELLDKGTFNDQEQIIPFMPKKLH